MPGQPGLLILSLALEDQAGTVLHRNFTTFVVGTGDAPRDETVELEGTRARLVRFAPSSFESAQ